MVRDVVPSRRERESGRKRGCKGIVLALAMQSDREREKERESRDRERERRFFPTGSLQ